MYICTYILITSILYITYIYILYIIFLVIKNESPPTYFLFYYFTSTCAQSNADLI